MAISRSRQHTGHILTDAESFEQIVDSIAGSRSVNEKRRYPRFPTAEALDGEIGKRGFSGFLVSKSMDLPESGKGDPVQDTDRRYPEEDKEEIREGFNILDFSEEGVQIQFVCDDIMQFSRRQIYLEINKSMIPVSLRWCNHSRSCYRGGFAFLNSIDANYELASFISCLNSKLIDYLVRQQRLEHILEHKEEGVFIYIDIFYDLRLKFLEALAGLKQVIEFFRIVAGPANNSRLDKILSGPLLDKSLQISFTCKLSHSSQYKRFIDVYTRPFYDYGCCLIGRGEDAIFLENDFLNCLLNTIIICRFSGDEKEDLIYQIQAAYKSFRALRCMIPGVFAGKEFDGQFFCYDMLITKINLLRDRIIDFLSSAGKHQF